MTAFTEADSYRLESQLKESEGFRLAAYRCAAGALTVGYGHNCDASPVDGVNRVAEALEAALARIKAKRLEVEYAGPLVDVDGTLVRFPSEVKDETRLNSLAGLFMADPAAQIPDWKIADNVYVTMTAPLLQQVKSAGFAHIAAAFSVERLKREALEAAVFDAAAEVEAWLAENLNTGWPGPASTSIGTSNSTA